MPTISSALLRVRARIAEAAAHAGRAPGAVELIAVSKTFPAADVLEAMAAGQAHFGENRVEEALPKIAAVRAAEGARALELNWHLIGHLQSRKAPDAAGRFALIHSIDSLRLAARLDARVPAGGVQPILLQCNVSGEASKEGFDLAGWQHDRARFDAFVAAVTAILGLPRLRVRGLMTIAPIGASAEDARPVFASLRGLRDALRERFPQADWAELSMGMSDDLEAAVAEGATLVRVGRAIFGARG